MHVEFVTGLATFFLITDQLQVLPLFQQCTHEKILEMRNKVSSISLLNAFLRSTIDGSAASSSLSKRQGHTPVWLFAEAQDPSRAILGDPQPTSSPSTPPASPYRPYLGSYLALQPLGERLQAALSLSSTLMRIGVC
ncbi:hypothetical protein LWI28_029245 [Acer negundo]|uniref:Uncharacterized protein n=1 Tax=Acer negundo TaxID=4023 RepID=A0AAD5INH2_ACENE|nr:hypothetical protein LWI28_029245 [Acer negundo]